MDGDPTSQGSGDSSQGKSMEVEEVPVTHYDWMRMTGELPMTTSSESLKTYLAKDRI